MVTALQDMDARRRSNKKRTDLSTALRRFNQAFSRDTDEDKVVDLAIAMEASLLAGEKFEQANKAMTRGAAFLANSRDPSETGVFIKKFYDARSRIVHNGESLAVYCGNEYCKQRDLAPPRFVAECEEVVRAILREFLSLLTAKPEVQSLQDHARGIDDTLLKLLDPQ